MNRILILFFIPCYLFSSELDTFTALQSPLEDGRLVINNKVSLYLKNAIDRANELSSCSKKRLWAALSYEVAAADAVGINIIEHDLNDDHQLPKNWIKFKDSVFKDLNFFQSIALNTYGLGPVIRVGDFFIGTDKIGHFFSEGLKYYQKANYRHWDVIKALEFGAATERGLFGNIMTGVYSYGDLAANFHGMRFWWNIFRDHPEILKQDQELTQLISCKNGRWQLIKDFDISEYVDASWDESINCNHFSSKNIREKIEKRIIEQGSELCPREKSKCTPLNQKYGNYASYLLAPECRF